MAKKYAILPSDDISEIMDVYPIPVQIVDDQGASITSFIGATQDAGPSQAVTRLLTESADMTTAAAITNTPASGQKIVATDILVSTDTSMKFTIQMETSENKLSAAYIPAYGAHNFCFRGLLKGDAADKKLFGKASVSGNVSITAIYYSEA